MTFQTLMPLNPSSAGLVLSFSGYASSGMKKTDSGMYTVEGAFTIVIFTVLIMMLLSIITIIETEAEIQSAIDQTAMQLSQYSYAVGDKVNVDNDETTLLKSILQDAKRELVGFATGSALCEPLAKSRIDEKYLYLVDGGASGLNFSASNVLGDGRTINVTVIYRINVNTFGLFDKQLTVCQKARTAAWLPYYADELAAVPSDSAGRSSIWHETNFARGKYFVAEQKEKNPAIGVSPGQGIDFYDKETGRVTEVFSMNIFNSYYSFNSGDPAVAGDYAPNEEMLSKQLNEYVRDYKKDIRQCGRTITMDSGAEERFTVNEKEMILILPNEAEGLENFDSFFRDFRTSTLEKDGINLKIIYREDAL